MKLPKWSRFQVLAVATALGAFVLMIAGGFVTTTGSGRACPDWPMCQGQIVPDLSDPGTAIEWTHRTVATIVGILVIATTILAWLDRRDERRVLFAASMSLVLVIAQGALGAATVLLPPDYLLVVAHLAVGAAFFALTVATALLALVLPPRPSVAPASRAPGTAGDSD